MKYYITFEQLVAVDFDECWDEGFSVTLNADDAEKDHAFLSSSSLYRNVSPILIPLVETI